MESRQGQNSHPANEVWLYSDGCYRWVYEKDLHGNRFEINYVLKIVILVFVLSWVLLAPIGYLAGEDHFAGMAFAITTGTCLGGGLLAVGIILLVQRLSANARGGTDVIGYEMNAEGLRQIHSPSAQRVNEQLGRMTLAAGVITGNPQGVVVGGQLMREGAAGVTRFDRVRRMQVLPRWDLIDLTLKGNYKCRVYVRPEDIDFVRDYIAEHIPR